MKRSKSRPRRHASKDSEDGSTTHEAHSIESNSFQDHADFHESHPDKYYNDHQDKLHGDNSFQDHQESTDFIKKTFATIYRSKSVASISNETDPEGKTKILTILQIKLPH